MSDTEKNEEEILERVNRMRGVKKKWCKLDTNS